jgi:hypothetical protein
MMHKHNKIKFYNNKNQKLINNQEDYLEPNNKLQPTTLKIKPYNNLKKTNHHLIYLEGSNSSKDNKIKMRNQKLMILI